MTLVSKEPVIVSQTATPGIRPVLIILASDVRNLGEL